MDRFFGYQLCHASQLWLNFSLAANDDADEDEHGADW